MQRSMSWILLLLVLVGFRALGAAMGWANFSPLPALVLCCLIYFQGNKKWLIPLAAWLVTDPLMNWYHGAPMLAWDQLGIVLGLVASVLVVPFAKKQISPQRTMMAAIVSAVLFYVVTNTVAFLTLRSFYPLSWVGFVQSQWTGPEGLGPTWIFLRNSLAANIFFTSVFLLAVQPICLYLTRPRVNLSQG